MSKKTKRKNPKATGDCYDAALKFAAFEVPESERDQYRVVHGWPVGTGGEIVGVKHDHAWVERTDPIPEGIPEAFSAHSEMFITVIDKSNGKDMEMSRTVYYAFGQIRRSECRYYTVSEAMALAVKHKNWGPWEAKPEIHECRDCGFTADDIGVPDSEIVEMFATKDQCLSCAEIEEAEDSTHDRVY